MSVCVVIPVYKETLTSAEIISLKQCISILGQFKIVFAAANNLDLQKYEEHCGQQKIATVRFQSTFFESIGGYNQLLLSENFYRQFIEYQNILIYQLDAYVFNDKLEAWCNKNYSYIGAPWFRNFETTNGENELWAVGNGGFSLRRVNDFLAVFKHKGKIFSFSFLWQKYSTYSALQRILRLPKIMFQYFFQNSTQHLYQLFGENEDHFWSFHAPRIDVNFKIAPIDDALNFAFECNPRKMYKLNQNRLPFGVHAWEKYGKDFWLAYISENHT